jgi:hypothetical protein
LANHPVKVNISGSLWKVHLPKAAVTKAGRADMKHVRRWAVADVTIDQQFLPEGISGNVAFKEGHAGRGVLAAGGGGGSFVASAVLGLNVETIAADPRNASAAGIATFSTTQVVEYWRAPIDSFKSVDSALPGAAVQLELTLLTVEVLLLYQGA